MFPRLVRVSEARHPGRVQEMARSALNVSAPQRQRKVRMEDVGGSVDES